MKLQIQLRSPAMDMAGGRGPCLNSSPPMNCGMEPAGERESHCGSRPCSSAGEPLFLTARTRDHATRKTLPTRKVRIVPTVQNCLLSALSRPVLRLQSTRPRY